MQYHYPMRAGSMQLQMLQLAAAVALAVAGCGDPDRPLPDGPAFEAGVVGDGGPMHDAGDPLFADFTVDGCVFEDDGGSCRGTAPLALTFVPLVAASVETYQWDFGDGTEFSVEPSPTHVYEVPGVFDVSLAVAGQTGTAAENRPGFAIVEAVPTGGPCELDEQCESGECICDATTDSCEIPLDAGFCTTDCTLAGCADEPCVDLTLGVVLDGETAPWRGTWCLAECEQAEDCPRSGFECQELPARDPADGWVRACFPPILQPVGGACAAVDGTLDASQCAGGQCWPAGALGLCAADCAERDCPAQTACATFGIDAAQTCLAICGADFSCESDALLACESPDESGDWGFSTTEGATDTYCAPRRCAADEDCAPPLGQCDLDTGGFCVAATADD